MKKTVSDTKLFAVLLCRLLLVPLRNFVVIPIVSAVIGIILVSRITDWWTGADSYYIYLVGDHKNDQVIADVFEGFREQPCNNGDIQIADKTINNVPVKAKCVDDEGEPAKARQISDDLAKRDDTLMVIGHVKSTQTKAALPNYLIQARPPIPAILTLETNPHLIPGNQMDNESSEDYQPVFRLWPTDDKQAAEAGQFALKHNHSVLWVVEDKHNPVYSQYLASRFVQWAQANHGKVVMWSTNMAVPPAETLRELKIGFVFFAGDWSNALILINQIKRIFPPKHRPTLFLSDASVNPQLITYGGSDLDEINIYLTFPLTSAQYFNDGFKTIGKDARSIVDWLIDDTSQHFETDRRENASFKYWLLFLLNRHEVEDARTVLNSRMEKAVRDDKVFESTLDQYQFVRDNGKNSLAQWHIWKVEKVEQDDATGYQFVDGQ
ncbi:branched-chain amino acid transport system substrate-binding protein [Nitrosomonas aestuarii]|uniref:Branched-chain amino acid transport system substrate-binding protein n=1 Tax=Nitrosomonas aestuarii TaxID=52441 RepID=A0A1I3YSH8_9PROT|nr:ABC transporter substrate-binding protein [Nitrosomonas aestuarii]SFK34808.1 branched-chain amino acid transport system substrate-binding protein [Nitrosomonas aestuarii]